MHVYTSFTYSSFEMLYILSNLCLIFHPLISCFNKRLCSLTATSFQRPPLYPILIPFVACKSILLSVISPGNINVFLCMCSAVTEPSAVPVTLAVPVTAHVVDDASPHSPTPDDDHMGYS